MTPKQFAFASAVLDGKNNRQAAIAAGEPEDRAAQAGYRMANTPKVKQHIELQRAIANGRVREAGTKKRTKKASESDHPLGIEYLDPQDFLLAAMNNTELPITERIKCAGMLMPYRHARAKATDLLPRTMTKGQQQQEDANSAMSGVFGSADQVGTLQ